jgi:hypothetical protein
MIDLQKEITALEAQRATLEQTKSEALAVADRCAVDLFHVAGALQILNKLLKASQSPAASPSGEKAEDPKK